MHKYIEHSQKHRSTTEHFVSEKPSLTQKLSHCSDDALLFYQFKKDFNSVASSSIKNNLRPS